MNILSLIFTGGGAVIITTLINWLVARRKANSESKKIDADTGSVIVDTTERLVRLLDTRLTDQQAEMIVLRQEVADLRGYSEHIRQLLRREGIEAPNFETYRHGGPKAI